MARANKKPGAACRPGFRRASRESLFVDESRYIVNNSKGVFSRAEPRRAEPQGQTMKCTAAAHSPQEQLLTHHLLGATARRCGSMIFSSRPSVRMQGST